MKRIFLCVAAMLVVDASGVFAQQNSGTVEKPIKLADSIVVSANRTPTPLREIASSVSVITQTDIEMAHVAMVSDLLRIVPGINVVQSGGTGGVTSVFIRGANSQHTLVLLDGIEMNDPSSPNGAFDFKNLRVDNIERIEILRGPQSVLYGSDAIGGVIQIFSKKGNGKLSANALLQGGSFGSRIGTVNLSGSQDRFRYSLALSRQETDGISSASDKLGNLERDYYGNTDLSLSVGASLSSSSRISLVARHTDALSNLDKQFGTITAPDHFDDPNDILDSKENQLSVKLSLGITASRFSHQFGLYVTDYERRNVDKLDALRTSDSTNAFFEGSKLKFDWQGELNLSQSNRMTIGVETENEQFSADALFISAFGPFSLKTATVSARTSSIYLLDQLSLSQKWYNTVGLRLDDHEQFGSIVTYRITSAYLFDKAALKLKASYGTGYKAPSLAQLFDLNFGNPDLSAEESNGWEIGAEKQILTDKVTFGLTYFEADYDNLIVGDKNIAKAVTSGLEFFTSAHFGRTSARFDYTYTKAREKPSEEKLIRRPEQKISVDFTHSLTVPLSVNVRILYVGERDDFDFRPFPAQRVKLQAYAVTNLAVSYDVAKNIRFFGRVENLFDRDYQEVFTYGVLPLSGHLGVKVGL